MGRRRLCSPELRPPRAVRWWCWARLCLRTAQTWGGGPEPQEEQEVIAGGVGGAGVAAESDAVSVVSLGSEPPRAVGVEGPRPPGLPPDLWEAGP